MNTEDSISGFECPLSFGYDPAPSQLMNWKDWVSKNNNAKENEKQHADWQLVHTEGVAA